MKTSIKQAGVLWLIGLSLAATFGLPVPVLAHKVHNIEPVTPSQRSQESVVQLPTTGDLIRQYSLSGDDGLIKMGWQRLRPQLDAPNPNVATLLDAAWLAQAEHNFTDALKYVDQVLAVSPRYAPAWLLRASILTVQGRRDAARAACRRVSLHVSPTVAVACSARLAVSAAEKQVFLTRLEALQKVSTDSPHSGWVYSVMADLAMATEMFELAGRWYEQSIAQFPSVQVRAAYADLLLREQQPQAVLALLDDTETAPALAIRRLLAAQKMGLPVVNQATQMNQQFRQWYAAGDVKHAREMVLFYLDIMPDVELAVALAEENVRLQAEPEDLALLQRAKDQAVEKS